jgi:pimeloyl-ACP methyl ester carboxylesterase
MLRGYARSGGTGTPDTVAGPALLLLHGGPAITDFMDLLGTEVAGWRAIRYQQRCLSPSATGGPFTVERHVADAVAVLDGLGVDRAVVAGHPWGGHLALQLAVAHPDRVAGLLIIDSPGANGDVTHLAVARVFRSARDRARNTAGHRGPRW